MKKEIRIKLFNTTKSIGVFLMTLFTISIITFFLVKLSPGDPAENYLRASHVAVTKTTLEKARDELGLNKPLAVQYFDWIKNVLKGDLGNSYLKKTPVFEMLINASISTFQIGGIAFIILVVFSTALGLISALNNNKFIDYAVQVFSFITASIPTFWLGYILIIIFAVKLKLVPVSGKSKISGMILPCITLVTPIIGQTTLVIRKNILEQMKNEHIENAILCGVKKLYIIKNHLLKNALIPIITVLSLNMLYLVTGSVLIEEVFAYPGIGKMFVTAVKGGDMPVIQGFLLFFGVLAIVVNLITAKLVNFINPITRANNKVNYEKSSF